MQPATAPFVGGQRMLTGRQFVGSAGFDSPFDIPEPMLIPVAASAPRLTLWQRLRMAWDMLKGG
jgi:hypothetical protein